MESPYRPFENYEQYLRQTRGLVAESAGKHMKHLAKVQTALGRPLLEASVGSEIDDAIARAAEDRKKKWNGGHIDDGAGMRFRLGMATSCFLRWAHRERLVDRNLYDKNSYRRPRRREAKHLTEEKLRFIFQCDRLSVSDIAMIRFLLDTGLRISEFCRVKLTDVDFKERIVTAEMTKVDRTKRVPFSEITEHWVAIALSIRGTKSDWLFCDRDGRQLSTHAVRIRFRKISQTLEFRVTPHMIRHTTGTLLIQHTQQLVVAQHLGHTDLSQTKHYLHLSAGFLRRVQEEMYKKIPQVLEPSQKSTIY